MERWVLLHKGAKFEELSEKFHISKQLVSCLLYTSKNSRYGCICCFYYGDELRTDHFTVTVFEKR